MTRSPRQRGPTDLLDVSSPEPWADRAGKVASRSGAHAAETEVRPNRRPRALCGTSHWGSRGSLGRRGAHPLMDDDGLRVETLAWPGSLPGTKALWQQERGDESWAGSRRQTGRQANRHTGGVQTGKAAPAQSPGESRGRSRNRRGTGGGQAFVRLRRCAALRGARVGLSVRAGQNAVGEGHRRGGQPGGRRAGIIAVGRCPVIGPSAVSVIICGSAIGKRLCPVALVAGVPLRLPGRRFAHR